MFKKFRFKSLVEKRRKEHEEKKYKNKEILWIKKDIVKVLFVFFVLRN